MTFVSLLSCSISLSIIYQRSAVKDKKGREGSVEKENREIVRKPVQSKGQFLVQGDLLVKEYLVAVVF